MEQTRKQGYVFPSFHLLIVAKIRGKNCTYFLDPDVSTGLLIGAFDHCYL